MRRTLEDDGGPRRPVPGHLSNIQILRGIAAAMVLVYHLGNEFGDRGFPGDFPDVGVGSAGVDIFFVISGFVMVHSARGAFRVRGAPGLFLARRIVRIVPLYWACIAVFAAALALSRPAVGRAPDLLPWLAASYGFLFYPRITGGDFPYYAPGWTLNFEMFFYLCFAAVLPMRRDRGLWTLSLGMTALTGLGLLVALPWPMTRWADTNAFEFVLGVGLAVAHGRGCSLPLWGAGVLAAAGGIWFAATIGSVDGWLPYRGFVWGPPACAIVAAAALYRPRRAGRIRAALERVGDASYPLYLVHYAVFVAVGDAIEPFRPVASLPPVAYGALCLFTAAGTSLAVHRWVERPMTRRLNAALGLPGRWAEVMLLGTTAPAASPAASGPRPLPTGRKGRRRG